MAYQWPIDPQDLFAERYPQDLFAERYPQMLWQRTSR
jgi:hypothetical protein